MPSSSSCSLPIHSLPRLLTSLTKLTSCEIMTFTVYFYANLAVERKALLAFSSQYHTMAFEYQGNDKKVIKSEFIISLHSRTHKSAFALNKLTSREARENEPNEIHFCCFHIPLLVEKQQQPERLIYQQRYHPPKFACTEDSISLFLCRGC